MSEDVVESVALDSVTSAAEPAEHRPPQMWQRYGLPGPGPGERMGRYSPIVDGPKPKFFSLRAQLLEDGRSVVPLAETENMWSWIKVYASGGENVLHAHTHEDHMFIILSGRATFYGPEGEAKELGRNDGLMLPAGTLYYFNASGGEPLVLLRVGTRSSEGPIGERMGGDGELVPGGSKKNKFKPPVFLEGAYYE